MPISGAFLKSLTFGAVIAASIGPVALLIVGTAANRGLWSGFFAGLGAALADLVYALVAFSTGALLLPLLEAQVRAIRIGSALLLIGFAILMICRDVAARRRLAAGHQSDRRGWNPRIWSGRVILFVVNQWGRKS